MGTQRDVYRQKLYDAERKAFVDQPYDKERRIDDCRARIHELARTSMAWRLACTPDQRDRVISVDAATGGTSWANSGRWRIQVARYHNGNDWVLIHEMAHLPTHNNFQAHGREFTELYVAMVREIYGDEQADRLRFAIVAEGVPIGRPPEYVKYLRQNIRNVANGGPDRFDDVRFTLKDGRMVYCSQILFDGDTVTLQRSYSAATPVSIQLEDVAYFSAHRIGRRPPKEWWED